jgi:hypothetical protein
MVGLWIVAYLAVICDNKQKDILYRIENVSIAELCNHSIVTNNIMNITMMNVTANSAMFLVKNE